MNRASWTMEIGRWLVAAMAAAIAYFGTFHFIGLFAWWLLPEDLSRPTLGFLVGSLTVLAGSLLAPRYQFVTAIVATFVLGISLRISFGEFPLPLGGWVVGGGLVASAFIVWWFHPRRTRRSTIWVWVAACATFLLFLGLVYSRRLDMPARPDPVPPELARALGPSASAVTTFYRYDLGGFIFNSDSLWRIDANTDAIARVVSGLGLHRTNAVPQRFWKMPPHYWPRSMPADAETFQSSAFSADTPRSHGEHYFLLHDRAQGRAFVWVKSCF